MAQVKLDVDDLSVCVSQLCVPCTYYRVGEPFKQF